MASSMIHCPYCGKFTDPRIDTCVHCGGVLQKAPGKAQTVGRQAGSQTCPNCGALVQEGDIICVACGTNLLTGQRVSEQETARPARRTPVFAMLAGAVGVVLVIAVIVILVAIITGDPVDEARRLAAEGRISEATDLLERHVREEDAGAEAHRVLAAIYTETGRYGEAANAYDQVARMEDGDPEAALLAAASRAQTPGHDLAREMQTLRTYLDRNPQDEQAWYLLALAAGAAGDFETQREALDALLELAPDHAEGRRLQLIAQAMRGNEAAAREALSQARAAADADPGRLAEAGFISALVADAQAAADALSAAAEADPTPRAGVQMQLGLTYLQAGAFNEALQVFDQVAVLPDAPAGTDFFRGLALQGTGATTEALNLFRQVAQDDGRYSAEAATQAASIYLGRGEPERAEELVNRAAELGADGPVYHTVRGRVEAAFGNLNEARAAFRTAMNIDETYAPAWLESGLVLIQQDATAEGVQNLRQYLERAPAGAPTRPVRDLIDQLEPETAAAS
jgi:tetratricopeptide (TPR) repeat protein